MKNTLKTVLLASALGLTLPAAALAGGWEGPYVGAFGAYVDSGMWGAGAELGYNFDLGNSFYAGAEGSLLYLPSGTQTLGTAAARVGYALTPDLLGFGMLGVAHNFASGINAWMVGGGLEYMAYDPVSLRVDAARYQVFGGGAVNYVMRAGVVWHF